MPWPSNHRDILKVTFSLFFHLVAENEQKEKVLSLLFSYFCSK